MTILAQHLLQHDSLTPFVLFSSTIKVTTLIRAIHLNGDKRLTGGKKAELPITLSGKSVVLLADNSDYDEF